MFASPVSLLKPGQKIEHLSGIGDDWQFQRLFDLDADGRIDLLDADHAGTVWWHRNRESNATPDFETAGVRLPQTDGRLVQVGFGLEGFDKLQGARATYSVGDIDGDGRPDLVMIDTLGVVRYFRQAAGATPVFDPPIEIGKLRIRGVPCVVDWDGDGRLDVVAGSDADNVCVFLNRSSVDKASPLAPATPIALPPAPYGAARRYWPPTTTATATPTSSCTPPTATPVFTNVPSFARDMRKARRSNCNSVPPARRSNRRRAFAVAIEAPFPRPLLGSVCHCWLVQQCRSHPQLSPAQPVVYHSLDARSSALGNCRVAVHPVGRHPRSSLSILAAMWPDSSQTQQLLDAARAGDAAARSDLLERHRDALARMVGLRMDPLLKRRLDASDIVQDVLVEAHRRLADYLEQRADAVSPLAASPGARPLDRRASPASRSRAEKPRSRATAGRGRRRSLGARSGGAAARPRAHTGRCRHAPRGSRCVSTPPSSRSTRSIAKSSSCVTSSNSRTKRPPKHSS